MSSSRDAKELVFECKDGDRTELDLDAMAAFFKENGFLIVKKFFSDKEVNAINSCVEKFASSTESTDWYCYMSDLATPGAGDKTPILTRIEHLRGHEATFDSIVYGSELDELVSKIWPKGHKLLKDKINMKMPGQGPDLLHQDIQAGWTKYAPDFISACIFLDDNTEENAAMSVMCTGKHPRKQLTPDFELLPDPYPPFVPKQDYHLAEGPRGSIVLFDAFVPHGSPGNMSKKMRRNFFATWNQAEFGDNYEQYFADKLKTYPPDHMRDFNKTYRYKA